LRLILVVGARPNFVKAEPLLRALASRPQVETILLHTGQHYDPALSQELFTDLQLRQPDRHLGVGSGSRSQQLAKVIAAFESACLELKPDQVVVFGDVNSTLGAAMVAQSLDVRVAHVEAGLRSRDRSMPEEINRVLTDELADLLFTPTEEASENLLREGIPASRIRLVGNIMIDSLVRCLPRAAERQIYSRWDLRPRQYALATVHRPSNVDDVHDLRNLVTIIRETTQRLPLVFSIHPRTMASLERFDLLEELKHVEAAHSLYPPLSYLDFLNLMANARVVLTDSGGIQEETSVLGIPCLTLRPNTERPITLTQGTNALVGSDPRNVIPRLDAILAESMPRPSKIALWDGHTAERIVSELLGD